MKFQSALFAVAVADIEPLKRLDTLVRSCFHIQTFKMVNDQSHSFINKGLAPREYRPIWAKIFGHVIFGLSGLVFSPDFESTGQKCL